MNTSYLQEYRNTHKQIDDLEKRAAFLAENALLEAVAPLFKEFPKAAFIALQAWYNAAYWRLGETGFEAPSFESAKGYGDFEQDSWQRGFLSGLLDALHEFDLFGDFEPGEYIITRDKITRDDFKSGECAVAQDRITRQ